MIQLQDYKSGVIYTTSAELLKANLPEDAQFTTVITEENSMRHLCEQLVLHAFLGDMSSMFLFQMLFPAVTRLSDAVELLDVIQLLQAHSWHKTFATCVLMRCLKYRPRQAMLETWRVNRVVLLGRHDRRTAAIRYARNLLSRQMKEGYRDDCWTDDVLYSIAGQETDSGRVALYTAGFVSEVQPLWIAIEPAFKLPVT